VNLRAAYRRWAEQNPDEARWFPWIWTGAALIACAVAWSLFAQWRAGHFTHPVATLPPPPPPPALAPGEFARHIEQQYPNSPDVWATAAQQPGLSGADLRALQLAAKLRPSPAGSGAADADALRQTAGLMAAGEPQNAAAWLDQQPAALRAHLPLQARRADLFAAQHQLPQLKAALETGAWGAQNADALDLAFASAAAFDQRVPELAADLWRAALDQTNREPAPLAALERLATGLGMVAEAELTFTTERSLWPQDAELLHRLVVWASVSPSAQWSQALRVWSDAAPEEARADARLLRPRS
jgi:hypothetical protein